MSNWPTHKTLRSEKGKEFYLTRCPFLNSFFPLFICYFFVNSLVTHSHLSYFLTSILVEPECKQCFTVVCTSLFNKLHISSINTIFQKYIFILTFYWLMIEKNLNFTTKWFSLCFLLLSFCMNSKSFSVSKKNLFLEST